MGTKTSGSPERPDGQRKTIKVKQQIKHYTPGEVKPDRAKSAAECFEQTSVLYPNIEEIKIPREIADDYTLHPYAKMLYGVLNSIKQGSSIRKGHLAGLSGMSVSSVDKYMRVLKQRQLIHVETTRYFSPSAHQFVAIPSRYWVCPPPKRVYDEIVPALLRNNIQFIENKFKDYFDEIKI